MIVVLNILHITSGFVNYVERRLSIELAYFIIIKVDVQYSGFTGAQSAILSAQVQLFLKLIELRCILSCMYVLSATIKTEKQVKSNYI